MTSRRELGDFGERVAKAHLRQRSQDNGNPGGERDTCGDASAQMEAGGGLRGAVGAALHPRVRGAADQEAKKIRLEAARVPA